uniref:protein-serine/threonine phosphatase n=1 Tax=Zea mays TaxID=4577 RepID=A0A804NE90_MAIZE
MAAVANAPRAGWPRTAPAARHALATPAAHNVGPLGRTAGGRRAGRAGPPSRCRAEAAPAQGPRARAGTRPRRNRAQATRSGCSALSIVKQGDLMVVANVGDSRVVLGTAFDDDAITSSSSSST